MTELKLVVGKSYVRRDGSGPFQVTSFHESSGTFVARRFDGQLFTYKRNGRWNFSTEECNDDLVAEWSGWTPRTVAALSPLELRETPILRALSAEQPKPEPRRFVRWFHLLNDGGYRVTERPGKRFNGEPLNGCIRVEFTEGQFDEPQPGDPV